MHSKYMNEPSRDRDGERRTHGHSDDDDKDAPDANAANLTKQLFHKQTFASQPPPVDPKALQAVAKLRSQLTHRDPEKMIDLGYQTESNYLKNVIKQVVVGNSDGTKVSTSIMVYGPLGCGKGMLVTKAIEDIQNECGEASFEHVILDSVYCSTLQDSVQAIWDQLVDVKDDETLEQMGSNENEPFDEKLEKMLTFLKEKLIELQKSVVIVIDGMEKFTDDSSQRLLYNLFDISANSVFSVPICIIGITPCVDILDSFEKRVRSRFSHRQINLVPKVEFTQYQVWAEQLLTCLEAEKWNSQVVGVLKDKDVIKMLRCVYDRDKSIAHLRRFLYYAILLCEDYLTPSHFTQAYGQLFGVQVQIQMALDLPISEMVVLLGIYKHIQRSLKAWTPAEIYEIIRKPYALYQLRKEDFIKTIIKLQDLDLIAPVGGSKQSRTNVYESYFKSEITFLEFQEVWKKYPHLPSFFKELL